MWKQWKKCVEKNWRNVRKYESNLKGYEKCKQPENKIYEKMGNMRKCMKNKKHVKNW